MKKELTRIHGIITPSDWAEDATVKAVSIATNDEQEYFVKNVGKGRDFLSMAQKIVNVEGLVTKNRKGQNLIEVKGYSIFGD